MIIAHFFLRNVRKQPCLFVETTSSNGIEQPSPAAQMLLKVKDTDKRTEWIKRAYYEFVKKFPNLVLLDTMENSLRLESSHPSFDLVFVPKGKRPMDETKPEIGIGSDETLLSVIKKLLTKH